MSSKKEPADILKEMIFKRTGIKPEELVCPREKSETTPCVARDGAFATADLGSKPNHICVGCEWPIQDLIEKEKEKGK